ncbi:MAG: hypothetical protein HOJ13_13750 [Nitrospina sp.]|nr:hypothetical protein [Nitrospina sp.]
MRAGKYGFIVLKSNRVDGLAVFSPNTGFGPFSVFSKDILTFDPSLKLSAFSTGILKFFPPVSINIDFESKMLVTLAVETPFEDDATEGGFSKLENLEIDFPLGVKLVVTPTFLCVFS